MNLTTNIFKIVYSGAITNTTKYAEKTFEIVRQFAFAVSHAVTHITYLHK